MQVNSINSYDSSHSKTAFTGGIQSRLMQKLVDEGCDTLTILKKTNEIYGINRPDYFLSEVVYDAKNKVAEFFLSVGDSLKFIPGMEKLKPVSVIAKGENVSEAFANIDAKELKKANEVLDNACAEQLEATKDYRQAIYDERQRVRNELIDKYNNARGFWIDYYRSIYNK